MNISIRDVDPKVFREFKVEVAREGTSMGAAFNAFVRHWLDCVKKQPQQKKTSLLDLKPFDWGPGTEKSSSEIDEVLYGGNFGGKLGGKLR